MESPVPMEIQPYFLEGDNLSDSMFLVSGPNGIIRGDGRVGMFCRSCHTGSGVWAMWNIQRRWTVTLKEWRIENRMVAWSMPALHVWLLAAGSLETLDVERAQTGPGVGEVDAGHANSVVQTAWRVARFRV